MADRVLLFWVLVLCGYATTVQTRNVSYKCDFEKGLCSFLRNDVSNKETWKIGRGGIEGVDIGPAIDHTFGTSEGRYIFINGTALGNTNSTLVGPSMNVDCCVHFWYHMYGEATGSLKVDVKEINNGRITEYFRKRKSQGDRWKEAIFSVDRRHSHIFGPYRVVFIAELGASSGYISYTALDDIEITQGACPKNDRYGGLLCSFNDDECGYKGYEMLPLPWKLVSGSHSTLVPIDHTLGTSQGRFWHMNAYNTDHYLKRSKLFSPSYHRPRKYLEACLQFYYYANANTKERTWIFFWKEVLAAQLEVYVHHLSLGTVKVWSRTKYEMRHHIWTYSEVKIKTSASYGIEFVGGLNTKVFAGLAIDDVKIIDGPCPEAGNCDFKDNMCSWTNGKGDIIWSRYSSDSTAGKYVYLSNEKNAPNSMALLESENFPRTDKIICVSFSYLMKGSDVGNLQVFKKDGNNAHIIMWHLDGHQSDKWIKAYAPSEPSSSSFQIVFKGVTGTGKTGLIAVTDIRILPGRRCTFNPLDADPRNQSLERISCSFEDFNFCHWTQPSESLEWKFGNDTLTPALGPKQRQPGNENGNFIFIHSYTKATTKFSVAKLRSPTISSYDPGSACFSFYYYMFGPIVGELRVFIVVQAYDKEERDIIWKRKGTHPDEWLLLRYNIDAVTNRNFKIEIEAEGGNGFLGIIAVDEISMAAGKCPDTELCDFESSTCGWTVTPSKGGKYLWRRGANLPKGPQVDHTTLTESGYYLQAVGMEGVLPADATHFVSPMFSKNSGSLCLNFWYYREGRSVGKISVITKKFGNRATMLWSVKENVGKAWQFAQVNVIVQEDFQIAIEAEKGNSNEKEMAIDDLRLENSACSSPGHCEFNKDYCGYSLNETSDFAWLLGTGKLMNPQFFERTPMDRTWPEGKYIYVDLTSDSLRPGKKAVLVSEIMEAPETLRSCLSFYHIIQGSDIPILTVGKMTIDTSRKDLIYKLKLLWSSSIRTGLQWTEIRVQISLSSYEKYRLYFQVEKGKGQSAFISIDDVTLEEGLCNDHETVQPPTIPTDFTSYKPGNATASSRICSPGEFLCNNRKCIRYLYKCNGYDDCGDGSDEQDCSTTTGTTGRTTCSPGKFTCENGDCVHSHYVCNGYNDCEDGSDERNCTTSKSAEKRCRPGRFRMWNGHCIDIMRVYDGHYDCNNVSHEIRCDECPEFAIVLGGVVAGYVLFVIVIYLTVYLKNRKHAKNAVQTANSPNLQGTVNIPRPSAPERNQRAYERNSYNPRH